MNINKFSHYFLISFITIALTMFFSNQVRAVDIYTYTLSQVAEHNNSNNCWMVIEGKVYDLTNFLTNHDDKLDIRSWCGQDATADYNTKAGQNKDHSANADKLLSAYVIGDLVTDTEPTAITPAVQRPAVGVNQYNVLLPILATIILYLTSAKLMPKPSHNFVWDSALLLGLVPSFVFGLLMALDLAGSNLLYYHVEWSIVFGTSCVLHLIFRLKIYISQGKFMFRKRNSF